MIDECALGYIRNIAEEALQNSREALEKVNKLLYLEINSEELLELKTNLITLDNKLNNLKLEDLLNVFISNSKDGDILIYNTVWNNNNLNKLVIFESEFIEPNTIYIIKDSINLNGKSLEVPENSILRFEGGSFSNGKLIFNNTSILAPPSMIFNNMLFEGSYLDGVAYSEWFGNINYTISIQNALNFLEIFDGGDLLLLNKKYNIQSIVLPPKTNIKGKGKGVSILYSEENNPEGGIIYINENCGDNILENFTILGTNSGNSKINGIYFLSLKDSPNTGNNNSHYYAIYKDKEISDRVTYKDIIINNVYICYCYNGIYVNPYNFRVNILNCDIKFCNLHGIYFQTTDSTIDNCYIEHNGLSGLYLLGSNNKVSNIKSIFNSIKDSVNEYGIKITGNRNLVINCETLDNYGIGYYLGGLSNLIIGCLANTDCYGKEPKGYTPELNPTGFIIASLNSIVKNCVVTNYSVKYGTTIDSLYRVVNNIIPEGSVDIIGLPSNNLSICRNFPDDSSIDTNIFYINNRLSEDGLITTLEDIILSSKESILLPKDFSVIIDCLVGDNQTSVKIGNLFTIKWGVLSNKEKILVKLVDGSFILRNLENAASEKAIVQVNYDNFDLTKKLRILVKFKYDVLTNCTYTNIELLYYNKVSQGYTRTISTTNKFSTETIDSIIEDICLYKWGLDTNSKIYKIVVIPNYSVPITSKLSNYQRLISFDINTYKLLEEYYNDTIPIGLFKYNTDLQLPTWYKGNGIWILSDGTSINI